MYLHCSNFCHRHIWKYQQFIRLLILFITEWTKKMWRIRQSTTHSKHLEYISFSNAFCQILITRHSHKMFANMSTWIHSFRKQSLQITFKYRQWLKVSIKHNKWGILNTMLFYMTNYLIQITMTNFRKHVFIIKWMVPLLELSNITTFLYETSNPIIQSVMNSYLRTIWINV